MACLVLKLLLLTSVYTRRTHANAKDELEKKHDLFLEQLGLGASTTTAKITTTTPEPKEKLPADDESLMECNFTFSKLHEILNAPVSTTIKEMTFLDFAEREEMSAENRTRIEIIKYLRETTGPSEGSDEAWGYWGYSGETKDDWHVKVAAKVSENPLLVQRSWKSDHDEFYFRLEASTQINYAYHFFQEAVVNYTTTPKTRKKRKTTVAPLVNITENVNKTKRRKPIKRRNKTRKTGTWSPLTRAKWAKKRRVKLKQATRDKMRKEMNDHIKEIEFNKRTILYVKNKTRTEPTTLKAWEEFEEEPDLINSMEEMENTTRARIRRIRSTTPVDESETGIDGWGSIGHTVLYVNDTLINQYSYVS
ncbi:hypothetical protein WDU94_002748 [Cyamophila willieti]